MKKLPKEIIQTQLLNLEVEDIYKKARTSKQINNAIKDDELWNRLALRDFGFNPSKLTSEDLYLKLITLMETGRIRYTSYELGELSKIKYETRGLNKLSQNIIMLDDFVQTNGGTKILKNIFKIIFDSFPPEDREDRYEEIYYSFIESFNLQNLRKLFNEYKLKDWYEKSSFSFLYHIYETDVLRSGVSEDIAWDLFRMFYENNEILYDTHMEYFDEDSKTLKDILSIVEDVYRYEKSLKKMKESMISWYDWYQRQKLRKKSSRKVPRLISEDY